MSLVSISYLLFIEIKRSQNVQNIHLNNLKNIAKDFGVYEALCFSRDPYVKEINGIKMFPREIGVKKYFS
jgi:hypothetical protein